MTADMVAVVLVYLAMAIAISAVAIHEDRLQKGFKPNAKDGDGDGIVQEGTKWARKVRK
jgi:hypothetical protein